MEKLKIIFKKLLDYFKKVYDYFGINRIFRIIVYFILTSVLNIFIPLFGSFLISVTIGILEEFYYGKYIKSREFDKKNLLSDFIGILLGCIF